MKYLGPLVKLSRPRFWMYLAGPYLFGYTLAYNHNRAFLTFESMYTFLFFLIPANIFLYGINDIFDRQTDNLNPKKKSKEQVVENTTLTLYQISVIISLIAAVPLFFFQSSISNILLLLFLFLSYSYSAPPFRFKIHPFIDSSSNILYAIPAFIGFSQLQNQIPGFLSIIIALLWTAAMHLYSAIPDIEYDKKVEMTTTAVYLGKQKSLWLCFILWFMMATLSTSISPFFIISFVYPLSVLAVIMETISLEDMYWKFPYITTILGFCLYVYAYNT